MKRLNESRQSEDDDEEPATKRLNVHDYEENLQNRLADQLNCIVCLGMPLGEIYQCINGHLMCDSCYIRLLAEARLKIMQPRCPFCRVVVPRNRKIRNFAAEHVLAELPENCIHCHQMFRRNDLERHQNELCKARPTQQNTSTNHTQNQIVRENNENIQILLQSLKMGRIVDVDLITTFCNTFAIGVYYTTQRFLAYGHFWAVRFRIVHPVHSHIHDGVEISYNLMLKVCPINIFRTKFFILATEQSNLNLPLKVHQHEFFIGNMESGFKELSLGNSMTTYRVLAAGKIKFRLFMMIMP